MPFQGLRTGMVASYLTDRRDTVSVMTTDNLAYWHMPKTGGMSVYRVMQLLGTTPKRFAPHLHRHGPISQVPMGSLGKRAMFGTVRDPWSWYTSLYQHAGSNEEGQERIRQMGNGDGSFRSLLRNLTDPTGVEEMPEMWGMVLPYDDKDKADWLASGLGLCSWVFRYTYGRPPKPDLFVDTAGLYDGLSELMNLPIETVNEVGPQNLSAHRPKSHIPDPESLYDDEMREWVAQADAPLIEMFGYEPFTRPDWTVVQTPTLTVPTGLR